MPAPFLTPEQAQLVARGECGCGCGRLLPIVARGNEWIVQPGRCWASRACRVRGCRQRHARPGTRAQRQAAWAAEAEAAKDAAQRLQRQAHRMVERAQVLQRRAARLTELLEAG